MDQSCEESMLKRPSLLPFSDNDFPDCATPKKRSITTVSFSDVVVTNQFDTISVQSENPFVFSCTRVLWIMSFCGFAIDAMLRVNMNITIVDMLAPKETIDDHTVDFVPECYKTRIEAMGKLMNTSKDIVENRMDVFKDKISIERIILDLANINYAKEGFTYDEYEQSLLLGSIFWLHWITQIPGGILARKYGAKNIFGLSTLISCLLCVCIPISFYIDFRIVLAIRILQGLVSGLAWPAMHHMVAQWIPPNERSRFFSSYMGIEVGIAIFFPLFGYIIAWSSWEWVFHACALIGIIWYIGWVHLVFESPSHHPRIDDEEKDYIEFVLKDSFQRLNKITIPWKSILTSGPVWVIILFQFGATWGMLTLTYEAPTYFNIIFGLDIRKTSIMTGLPHVFKLIFGYYFALYADYLLKCDTMSRRNVRVIAGLIANILFGVFTMGLAYSGCSYSAAILFTNLGHMVSGAISASTLANIVDLSPNFAGVIMGLVRTICVLPGFISPYVASLLLLDNQTIQQWKYLYLLTAFILVSSGALYALLTETDPQKWNFLPSLQRKTEERKQYLPEIIIENFANRK